MADTSSNCMNIRKFCNPTLNTVTIRNFFICSEVGEAVIYGCSLVNTMNIWGWERMEIWGGLTPIGFYLVPQFLGLFFISFNLSFYSCSCSNVVLDRFGSLDYPLSLHRFQIAVLVHIFLIFKHPIKFFINIRIDIRSYQKI